MAICIPVSTSPEKTAELFPFASYRCDFYPRYLGEEKKKSYDSHLSMGM